MATDNDVVDQDTIHLISYNMHGFNQGIPALFELIEKFNPGVILLQEHWLTPANLHKFDQLFNGYFHFGSSAMSHVVESGILRGRPFGGVMCMINYNLRAFTETVHCAERYAIIRLFNYLIVNVYFPCSGTADRELICDALLVEIGSWCDQYNSCDIILAGDLNVELDSHGYVSRAINRFITERGVFRCDSLFSVTNAFTYVNDSLGQSSTIDYIATSAPNALVNFVVHEVGSNLSDHLPIMATFNVVMSKPNCENDACVDRNSSVCNVLQFRWDKADIISYYVSQVCGCDSASSI